MASNCLPALVQSKNLNIVGVILASVEIANRRRYLWRRVKKIMRIGLWGAWNGRRIRPWFRTSFGDIEEMCSRYHVPFYCVKGVNSPEMVRLLPELAPDLGVSLGNGFIAERVFTIPRLGMINVHSEILPTYQNAQCIIWPIYFNDPNTGFTIHEIERKIDAGRILYRYRKPIRFCKTLEQTVRVNKAVVDAQIPDAVRKVCENILALKKTAEPQGGGRTYTTPSIWQFWRMVRNNARGFRAQVQKESM